MCGIAGFLDPVLQIVDRTAVLARMRDALIHRGPDDAGQIVDGPVGLGMRRLSIVDVAGGAQPMTSPDGAVTLVYNGEIYNHHEVRAQLEAVGRAFRTRSDTEVLLAQYERHGLDGLNGLNGMFAAAIWDRRSRRLHLMRDRMGVKPLYYFADDQRLYFASELKSLVAAASFTPEVNPRAVWDYLSFRYVPAPHTIWRNVRKLPPAHVLTVAEGDMAAVPRRWWDMPYALQGAEGSADVPADESEFAPLFEDAVNIRMVADVPVGVFLSGGLDSSAVVAAVDRERFPDLETFAISLDAGGEDDELGYARMVSRALGTRHHELSLSGTDFSAMLEDMPWHTDEPLADATCVPVLALARAARREVKVVLSGEGSDEILAGYTFDAVQAAWDAVAAAAIAPKTGRLASLIDRLGFSRPGSGGWEKRAARARHPGDQRDTTAPLHIVDYYAHEEKARLFRNGHSFPDSREILRQDLARVRDDEPLHQTLYLYSQNWLVEDLLMKADKMTMAASLELRTPFLDKRLVELAARLPRTAKLRRRADGSYETKAILRDYARAHLPREIIDRPKKGFPVPVYRWLSGPLKELVMDRLGAGSARCHAWLEPDAVRALAKAGTAADADVFSRHRLWNLLILELWLLRWTP
jgi:asparagine synthase (glutamine-hydrolysing)